MKNTRMKSITYRLFALVMALLLAAGGFMMDVRPAHAETVKTEENYSTTEYSSENTSIKITVENSYAHPKFVEYQYESLGPDGKPTGSYNIVRHDEFYPIHVYGYFGGKTIDMKYSPEDGSATGGGAGDDLSTYTTESTLHKNLIKNNTDTNATTHSVSSNGAFSTNGSQSWHFGSSGSSTSTKPFYKMTDSKYQLEVTCVNIVEGTHSVTYREKVEGEWSYENRSTPKYDITLRVRLYINTDGGQLNVIDENVSFTYYYNVASLSYNTGGMSLYSGTIPQRNNPDIVKNSSASFSIVSNYTEGSTEYVAPIVSDDSKNPLIKKAGDSVNWTEGIQATWGKTTSNVIKSTSTATTENGDGMGTIVDDVGADTTLSTDGNTFDKIGVSQHSYTIKDAHSLSNASQYANDNTSATVTRNIIVKTDASPTLEAYYAGANVVYGGEWLSQYNPGDETAPDASRFKSVDLKASGTGIPGTYDTVIWKGETSSGTEAKRGTNTNTATHTFGDETSADGQKFYANLQEVNEGANATNAGLTALSGNSAEKTIRIDSTPPTTNISVDTDSNDLYVGLTNSSSDELSGIDKTYVAFVEAGGAAPTITNGTWTEIGNVAEGTTYQAGKTYDIYAYSMDKATNKSAAKLLGSGVRTPITSVAVSKTADKDKVKLGDEITYTISVKNTGEVPVNDWKVTDTLGDGLTYVSDDASGTNSGQVTDWTVSLAVGETKEIKLVAKVANKDGAIKNGVEIRGDKPDDPNTDDDESIEDEDDSESTLQFDVTFVDEDGTTVLKEKTAYDYKTKAADIAKPADPKKAATDKYVYVFKGWEPEVSDVTEDVVYKATYEEKKKYFAFYDKDENSPVNPEDPLEVGEDEPKVGDIFPGDDGEEYKIIEIGELDPNTGEIPIKVGKLFTLTFNLEGGELNGQTEAVKMKAVKNETITILREPTREGYKFEYWQGSKHYPGEEYKATGHHTFKAIWTKLPDEKEEISEKPSGDDKEKENTEPEKTTQSAQKPGAEKKDNATESKKTKSAPTGDENSTMLWMILLGLAAIGTFLTKKLKSSGK